MNGHGTEQRGLSAAITNFDQLPDSARVDVKVVATILGVSVATVWRMVERKELAEPKRLGKRCTRWTCGDIRKAGINALQDPAADQGSPTMLASFPHAA